VFVGLFLPLSSDEESLLPLISWLRHPRAPIKPNQIIIKLKKNQLFLYTYCIYIGSEQDINATTAVKASIF
jgi:hypothetical protein